MQFYSFLVHLLFRNGLILSVLAIVSFPASISFAKNNNPTLSVNPQQTHLPVKQGSVINDTFTFVAGGSFHGNVNLAITGMPSFVKASWSHSPVTLSSGRGQSTLTLQPSASATINWFSFNVIASGDGLRISRSYTIEIGPSKGVQVQLSTASLMLDRHHSETLQVTANPINGVKVSGGGAGSSAEITSSLPDGVSYHWSKPRVNGSGAVQWDLTLSANGSADTGTQVVPFQVKITDKSRGFVYSGQPSLNLLVSLLANVTVTNKPANTIPATFMGFSHEWGEAQYILGDAERGVNHPYRQLLKNLERYGSGPVNLRIGGQSTDNRGEPSSTVLKPFSELNQAMGVHFELGINLGANNINLATDQAKAYIKQMPSGSIEALEIGNEPHLYNQNGLRPSNYNVQDYFGEFLHWRQQILPLVSGNTKVMGPSWCTIASSTCWAGTNIYSDVDDFASQESESLTVYSQHNYVQAPSDHPGPTTLLAPWTSTSGPLAAAPAVRTAHAHGVPFRMGEMSSISDQGVMGVSDAFGAALWAVDTMFEYAKVGVDGVNWEATLNNHNDPFIFSSGEWKGKTTYSLSRVSPLYYAFLFFQAATTYQPRMLPITLTSQANVKAFATLNGNDVPRVTILNKDLNMDGNVAISMPGYRTASLLRLSAPSYFSTVGIQFAGQTFDGSTDGMIQGDQVIDTIESDDGVFYVSMPTTSAALLILHR